jgi:hypothetical protein
MDLGYPAADHRHFPWSVRADSSRGFLGLSKREILELPVPQMDFTG